MSSQPEDKNSIWKNGGAHDIGGAELEVDTAESLAIERQLDFAQELVTSTNTEARLWQKAEIDFRAKNSVLDSATKAAAMRIFKEARESMELLLGNHSFLALVKVEIAQARSLILSERYGDLRSNLQSLIREFNEGHHPTYNSAIDEKCAQFVKHYLEPLAITLERLDCIKSEIQNDGRG